jgi:prevent-host-death family protein
MAMKKPKNAVWQLQEAKAMLSDVVKASTSVPQYITVHGRETAVILSMEHYRNLIRPKQSFYEFIRNSPLYGMELELPPRVPEEMRAVDL